MALDVVAVGKSWLFKLDAFVGAVPLYDSVLNAQPISIPVNDSFNIIVRHLDRLSDLADHVVEFVILLFDELL
jgi:hypothetical protein